MAFAGKAASLGSQPLNHQHNSGSDFFLRANECRVACQTIHQLASCRLNWRDQ